MATFDDADEMLDSISDVSRTSSARARAEAEKCSLLVKVKYCQRESELKLAQQRIENELKQLQLSALIEAASAREEVLAECENMRTSPVELPLSLPVVSSSQSVSVATVGCPDQVQSSTRVVMSPMAAELQPTYQPASTVPMVHFTGPSLVPPFVSPANTSNINSVVSPVNPFVGLTPEANSMHELISTLKLPQVQLVKFNGDPMQYRSFMRSFDNFIGNVPGINAAAKLSRLQQYCTGKVIDCCSIMEPEVGYRRARELLKDRFGNEYRISEGWIDKMISGAIIKSGDPAGLRDLADEARVCKETLEAMNMIDEIDTRAKMVKIVNRLPQYLQGKLATCGSKGTG